MPSSALRAMAERSVGNSPGCVTRRERRWGSPGSSAPTAFCANAELTDAGTYLGTGPPADSRLRRRSSSRRPAVKASTCSRFSGGTPMRCIPTRRSWPNCSTRTAPPVRTGLCTAVRGRWDDRMIVGMRPALAVLTVVMTVSASAQKGPPTWARRTTATAVRPSTMSTGIEISELDAAVPQTAMAALRSEGMTFYVIGDVEDEWWPCRDGDLGCYGGNNKRIGLHRDWCISDSRKWQFHGSGWRIRTPDSCCAENSNAHHGVRCVGTRRGMPRRSRDARHQASE